MNDVIPPQHWNAATTRSFTQFAGLWQQLHHLRHRIADDDPRRPTSAGLKIDEVAKLSSLPEPTTGDTFVELQLRGELAKRNLVFLERRNGIDGFPYRIRDRRLYPSEKRSSTSLRTTA